MKTTGLKDANIANNSNIPNITMKRAETNLSKNAAGDEELTTDTKSDPDRADALPENKKSKTTSTSNDENFIGKANMVNRHDNEDAPGGWDKKLATELITCVGSIGFAISLVPDRSPNTCAITHTFHNGSHSTIKGKITCDHGPPR